MTYRTSHNSLKFLNYIKFKNRSGTFLTPCIYIYTPFTVFIKVELTFDSNQKTEWANWLQSTCHSPTSHSLLVCDQLAMASCLVLYPPIEFMNFKFTGFFSNKEQVFKNKEQVLLVAYIASKNKNNN